MTRNLIVDGTKEIIANGRAVTMHAISNATDYTHTRIVGYAVTEEDAALFAAAPALRASAKVLASLEAEDGGRRFPAKEDCVAARAAISKSEIRT